MPYNIIVRVNDKNGREFHLIYESIKNNFTVISKLANENNCDVSYVKDLWYLSYNENKFLDYNGCLGININTKNNTLYYSISDVYFSRYDENLTFDDPRQQLFTLHNVGMEFILKLDKYLKNSMINFQYMMDPMFIDIDEKSGYIKLTAHKSFFEFNYSNFITLESINREEFSQNLTNCENNETFSLIIPLADLNYNKYDNLNKEHQDIKCLDDTSIIDKVFEESFYQKRIMKCARNRFSNKSLLQLSEIVDFISEVFDKNIVIFEDEGKGSHYKIKFEDDNGHFWPVSKKMREDGIYIDNLIDIIEALGINLKDAYQKFLPYDYSHSWTD